MPRTSEQNGKTVNRLAEIVDPPAQQKLPDKVEQVRVPPANMRTIKLNIKGTAPYLQCRFAEKAMLAIMRKQSAGDQPGKRPRRAPRDYEADYKGSMHKIKGGGYGIPAGAFRAAAISACRLIGFKMTLAKLSVFIVPDGFDEVDATPLVRIDGTPEKHVAMGRNADGVPDVRVRALFQEWGATLTIKFDADQFSLTDVVNLFSRVGQQVGVGEGRADSKNSAGLGYGHFDVVTE